MAREAERRNNGVVIYQITDGSVVADNIYCEASYCTPDSRWFVYRRVPQPKVAKWKYLVSEFVAVEFGTWREQVRGRGYFPAISPAGALFIPEHDGPRLSRIVRADIAGGASRVVMQLEGDLDPVSTFTVSSDERLLCFGRVISFSPQLFGIERLDLVSGHTETLFVSPSLCNSHTQFDPASHELLVQDNRGCRFKADGTVESYLGSEGCTLFALNADDGRVTPLRVGPPFTPSATGHEQWIGRTGEVLLSLGGLWSDGKCKGRLIVARPGLHEPRALGIEHASHVHAATDGRHFCFDANYAPDGAFDVLVGSLATTRTVVVAQGRFGPVPEGAPRFEQLIHGHPYLSPDNRWAIFNCWRTGRPQVYAASIPPEIFAALDRP